jgi:RIO kinase 1
MDENDKSEKYINQIDQKRDKQRTKTKRKTEERAAYGNVFDSYTLINIEKLRNKGVIEEFVGIISAGKEANVYFGYGENNKPIAIKIYKIDPQNTKWMKNYIIGDPRFKKIGTSTHKIIYTWCKKEFKNLTQMKRNKIHVPSVYFSKDNVLVMEYIGDDNGSPAPRLKDVESFENPDEILQIVLEQIRSMYIDAHLVHGDLSEYNILFFEDKPIIIDVSQAVSIYHYNAIAYLRRDVKNVLTFFGHFVPQERLPKLDSFVKQILIDAE